MSTTDQDRADHEEGRAHHHMLEDEHRRAREVRADDDITANRVVFIEDSPGDRLARDQAARDAMLAALAHDLGAETLTRMLHENVVAELRRLRAQRDGIADVIRSLVDQERVLGLAVTRFDRLAADVDGPDPRNNEQDTQP